MDIEDARYIARFLVDLTSYPLTITNRVASTTNADVTQDWQITIDDAFTVAKHLIKESLVIKFARSNGPGEAYAKDLKASLMEGDMVQVTFYEHYQPYEFAYHPWPNITANWPGFTATNLVAIPNRDGRSVAVNIDTRSLSASETAALGEQHFEPLLLASATDAFCPAPGISLEFRRILPHVSHNFLYLGPLGRGWLHEYDVILTEDPDGTITFHGSESQGNRFFKRDRDASGSFTNMGTFTAAPGDYGILTRDPDGAFTLVEKSGLAYKFLTNLVFDFIKDRNGNYIQGSYDQSNRLVKVQHSSGASFSLFYDAAGRITNLTDHVGRVTTYEYDPTSQMLTKVTDPSGAVTEYVYSVGQSVMLNYRLLSIAFPDGTHKHFTYDPDAYLTRITGTWGDAPISFGYDTNRMTYITNSLTYYADRIVPSVTSVQVDRDQRPVQIWGPDGQHETYSYDSAGNVVQKSDALGRQSFFGYDARGNLLAVTNPVNAVVSMAYVPMFDKPSAITNALQRTTLIEYDTNANPVKIIFSDGTRMQMSYESNGNVTSVTDAAGKTTRYSYNTKGLRIDTTNALGNVTKFSYDQSGQLEGVVEPTGNRFSFFRDLLGRLTRRTYPDGSHEDYQYDPGGKITNFVTRAGQQIYFSYNPVGRLEWKRHSSGKALHFYYDNRGLLALVEKVEAGVTNLDSYFEYDLSQRLVTARVQGKKPPETYDVSYAYDLAGNRKLLVYPDGYTLNYQYDAANRLTNIVDINGKRIVTYEYAAAGRRTRRKLGNDTYTAYNYDLLDRLTHLTNAVPDGTMQSRFAYTYNAGGVRTSMDTLQGLYSYEYDDTYQLNRVQYPEGKIVKYSYDSLGNRTNMTQNGTTNIYLVNALNQYTAVGNDRCTYDQNGNLQERTAPTGAVLYGWDEDSRLLSVDQALGRVAYTYDFRGRLETKAIGTNNSRYIWDQNNLIAELDGSGTIQRRIVYGANIDEVVLVIAHGTNYWPFQDALSSVMGETKDDGTTVSEVSYDAFGLQRSNNDNVIPQRFAGMIWDADSELYYDRARWYDPTIGRFLSLDFRGTVGLKNAYIYCHNNPVNLTDTSGLEESDARIRISDVRDAWAEWTIDLTAKAPLTPLVHTAAYLQQARTELAIREAVSNNRISGWGVAADWVWTAAETALEGFPVKASIVSLVYMGQAQADMHAEMVRGRLDYYSSLLPQALANPQLADAQQVVAGYRFFSGKPWAYAGTLFGVGSGGMCPTFIQYSSDSPDATGGKLFANQERAGLICRLTCPPRSSLVRADLPIFGDAGGRRFAKYRVEYGRGVAPLEWHIVASSDKPKVEEASLPPERYSMQGDLDIRGNLATWNTGLKNWSHLPWHPPEDRTDHNGLYTLRLVVEGTDGKSIEDRISCEVGRAIAQCLPGISISPDQKVVMRFPEQALMSPFRIYTILPISDVGEVVPRLPDAMEVVGDIYRIREPGDRFIKDVTLEFTEHSEKLKDKALKGMGICRFDVPKNEWVWLATSRDESKRTFSIVLEGLPAPKAIYALVYDSTSERSRSVMPETVAVSRIHAASSGVFCSFEKDLGSFKARDRFVGAKLERDNRSTADGSYCLKVVNENGGGNFSLTVVDQPFDVRELPVMTFDYRIRPGVKIDYLLRVDSRWYNLRFTGDPVDYQNWDVNIANLGSLEGIVADDKWHTAIVDLRRLLSKKTRLTNVDEIIMANWAVGGYMKLEFGHNPKGATFYLDNFRLTGGGTIVADGDVLLVDDFDGAKKVNALGGKSGVYRNPGPHFFETSLVNVGPSGGKSDAGKQSSALQIAYDVSSPDAYGGYWTELGKRDLSGYNSIRWRVKSEGAAPRLQVGIRNSAQIEGKSLIGPYVSPAGKDGWREVQVPLRALQGLTDFSSCEVLFITVNYASRSAIGKVLVDDLRFDRTPSSLLADFESPLTGSMTGGDWITSQNGAAVISASTMADPKSAGSAGNTVCRISYGGSIGRDYGTNGGFSYCYWEHRLNGLDGRPFRHLAFKARGEKGGETPNFYLSDGTRRVCLRSKETSPMTTEWQDIYLPLSFYGDRGIDLSHLDSFQIVFEWTEQSSTLYVDDLRFVIDAPPQSSARAKPLQEGR